MLLEESGESHFCWNSGKQFVTNFLWHLMKPASLLASLPTSLPASLLAVLRGVVSKNKKQSTCNQWHHTSSRSYVVFLCQTLSQRKSVFERKPTQRKLFCDRYYRLPCPWTSAVRGVAGFSVNFPFQQKARSFYQMHQERLIKHNNQTFWTRTVWPDTGIKCSPNFKIVA